MPSSLNEVARAISDGEPIDWRLASAGVEAERARRLLAGLRVVAAATGTPEGPDTAVGRARRDRVGRGLLASVRVLAALVLAQVLLAFAVAAWGPPAPERLPTPPVLLLLVALLASALVLHLRGGRDARAQWLAAVFLTVAAGPTRIYLDRLALEPSLASALAAGLFPECFFAACVWGFTRDFPRRRRFGRRSAWHRHGLWASAALALLLFLVNLFAWARLAVAPGEGVAALAARIGAGGESWLWPLQALAALPALLAAVARGAADDEQERRRVRWFSAALVVGFAPLLTGVLADVAWPAFARAVATPAGLWWSAWVIYGALLLVPVIAAYAVLARRLLDVSTALHGAARLALARATWGALTLLPLALLVGGLASESERTVGAAFSEPRLRALAVAAALGALLFLASPRLLARLEERWLGRLSELEPLLARFGRDALALDGTRELERRTRELLADLFGARRAALLLLDPARRTLASPGGAAPPLLADSAVARLLAASEEALTLDPEADATAFAWLPERERQWALDGDVALALPLSDRRRELSGVLAIGRSKSGSPYPRRVERAARAVEATVSLALEQLVAGARVATLDRGAGAPEVAGQCPACGAIRPDATGRCACGEALAPAPLPFELAGKFRLDSVLGRGGMGIVYRARDLELDREVALKTLPRVASSALVRMRREARAMAAVSHPHLATIYGVESFRGTPILVVELLAGGSLERHLGRPFHAARALTLVACVAEALAALHARGYLHRDVKPSNIALTANGDPKLLDFGLSLLVADVAGEGVAAAAHPLLAGRETASDHVVGTPVFLSPESLRGEPPTEQRDLWALGLVLWELLSGHHPWHALPQREALVRLARAELPPFSAAVPACPPEVARYLARVLAPRREARFASAAEMAAAARALVRELEREESSAAAEYES